MLETRLACFERSSTDANLRKTDKHGADAKPLTDISDGSAKRYKSCARCFIWSYKLYRGTGAARLAHHLLSQLAAIPRGVPVSRQECCSPRSAAGPQGARSTGISIKDLFTTTPCCTPDTGPDGLLSIRPTSLSTVRHASVGDQNP